MTSAQKIIDLNDPDTLMGRAILVTMKYVNPNNEVVRQKQRYGTIVDLRNWNLVIRREGHEDFLIPYDVRAMRVAPMGTYRLEETGEEISNPDLQSSWIVEPPGTPPHVQ